MSSGGLRRAEASPREPPFSYSRALRAPQHQGHTWMATDLDPRTLSHLCSF